MSYPVFVDPADLEARTGTGYPEPYRSRVLPREKRALGDAFGLTHVGINLTTLPPGKESSMRHWHGGEDEFVYILEGEVTLRTDRGEYVLRPGTCAGFRAGDADGHQLINRGDRPARYLEISNRTSDDPVTYVDPDVDLALTADHRFTHRDGTPY